ncbi:MAG: LysR family transcriptional regulator [Sphingobium sp.]|nr:LysR family transcriptional regulator [Sphingobium sp.]
MPFDIRQLRYAIAAADHGSFYRAAQAMGVEQSTLSRSVLKLERMIGDNIFNRSRAGVTLTIAGAQFIRSSRPMVASADRMVETMRAAGQGRAGGLMIGHYNSVSAGNLRATMLKWRQDHPDVDLDGVEATRSALFAGLDTGEIDIAILLGDANHDGFRHEPFWSERVIIALPTDHPLAERKLLHWTDLRRERFLLTASDPGPEIRDMLLGRLSVSGIQPEISMHKTSRESVLSVLGGGFGLTVICEGATGVRYPDVVYRPVHGEQGATRVEYSGYWREDNGNPALRRFLAFVRDRYSLSFDIPRA